MEKHLHIVSFSIPWPPDYGGAMDVFYKIKALAQMGIKIHLHCFQYDREPAPELEEFCTEVHYYSRQLGLVRQFSSLPYIVKTRINEEKTAGQVPAVGNNSVLPYNFPPTLVPAPELEEFCTEVHYYSRQLGLVRQFSSLPYIVKTAGQVP